MDSLLEFDQLVFEWINQGWRLEWLDQIMPWWRNKTTWVPLYVMAAGILIWQYRRFAFFLLIAVGITVGLADFTSSQVIKKSVQRLRPCNEISLDPPARRLVGCSKGYSFPSSHATNHFALATLLFLTWGRRWRKWRWLLLVWAASIALGQVYVGVHYPLDILGGGILGTLIGWGVAYTYQQLPTIRIADFYDQV